MRLKLLTNLNTLLLVAVCVALGATLWWSQKALERPYLLMERYLGLSRQFQNDVARNIEDYLASGDALRLSSASQAIDVLQKELGELPPALADTLRPSLSNLDEFSKTDLLAAGKLAGDPQALLLQAERELGASLDQLSQYASANAAYLTPLLAASQHLGRLSLARDKLVSSGRSELAADVEREVANIRTQAELLGSLPLLGVAAKSESNTDDFASMMGLENTEKAAAEDAGVGLKRELNSLLTRYPAELSRTRDQIQKRTDLSSATHLKIAAVQQAIAGLEPVVRAQHGQIQGEVRLMQGVMIGLILLIALLIDSLQRRLARTLTNLAPALSTWAEGDFSRDIELGNTNRELHDIQASLNRLRAYLADLVGTIRLNAEQVAGSSRTLADLSNDLHSGAEHQAGDTALIRDSLGELEARSARFVTTASEFTNWVGITCCALVKGVSKGRTFWCWAGDCVRPFRPFASDKSPSRAGSLPQRYAFPVGASLLAMASAQSPRNSRPAHPPAVRYHAPNSDTRDCHAPFALPAAFSARPAGRCRRVAGHPAQFHPGCDQQQH